MKNFGRKQNKDDLNLKLNSQDTLKNDFIQSAPFASYLPVEYTVYPPYMKYRLEIDAYLDKLFTSGAMDEATGAVLDNLIEDMFNSAANDLKSQRTEHHNTLRNLWTRRLADRLRFEKQLSQVEEILPVKKNELAEIQKRYNQWKFNKNENGGKQNEK